MSARSSAVSRPSSTALPPCRCRNAVDRGPAALADPAPEPRAPQAGPELLGRTRSRPSRRRSRTTTATTIMSQRLSLPCMCAEHAGDEQRGLARQHHADEDRGLGEAQARRRSRTARRRPRRRCARTRCSNIAQMLPRVGGLESASRCLLGCVVLAVPNPAPRRLSLARSPADRARGAGLRRSAAGRPRRRAAHPPRPRPDRRCCSWTRSTSSAAPTTCRCSPGWARTRASCWIG